jgi:hypothetical protein
MALVTDKVNMRSFEKNPVDLLAIDAYWRHGHQIARMYEKVKIEFFASYVLVDNEILIPKSKILRITLSHVEEEDVSN